MLNLTKSLLISGALVSGAMTIDLSNDTLQVPSNANQNVMIFAPNHGGQDSFDRTSGHVTPNMEVASDYADNFIWQLPVVIYQRLQSLMNFGTKGVLMQDGTTKSFEEQWIHEFTSSLKHMGDALAEETQAAQNANAKKN